MKLKYATLALLLVCFVFSTSCKKELTDEEIEARQNSYIMNWMYGAMDEVYFWSNTIPGYTTVKGETDPEAFFNKLIYTQEDKWSWLTKDYEALMAELDGTPVSTGFSSIPYLYSATSDKVFFVVTYVYQDSPAFHSGIKRGDIVVKIDNKELTTENYYTLYNQNSLSLTLGNYFDGVISPTSRVISVTSGIINSNPIVFDTVFQFADKKIAYLVYVEFISGKDSMLLDDFGNLMDDFKNQNVTDLVIDLRYNPGGEINAANYIASCIAPANVVSGKQVFVKFSYNQLVQSIFESDLENYSDRLVDRFSDNGHNGNFNQVYFLAGDRSASASELLMIGLEPYMNVIQIGDTTYGKYTGAWVLTDMNKPPKHNWAIVPIVSKYSNSEGFGNFKNGLYPDYYVRDFLLEAKAFGDISDPMLGKAIELITGYTSGVKKSINQPRSFVQLPNPSYSLKANLILKKPDFLNMEPK